MVNEIKKSVYLFLLVWCLAFVGCPADTDSSKSEVKQVTISASADTATVGDIVELSVSVNGFNDNPTAADVYVSEIGKAVATAVKINGGKILLDTTGFPQGTYHLFLKIGDVESNKLTVTLTVDIPDDSEIDSSNSDSSDEDDSSEIDETEKITISFHCGDGMIVTTAQSVRKNKSTRLNTAQSLGLQYENYCFIGWDLTSEALSVVYADGAFVDLSEDTDLYAVWKKSVSVTFNPNGGTIDTASQAVPEGFKTALQTAANLGLKNGDYPLVGWSLRADDETPVYSDGALVDLTHDITLYAVWTLSASNVSSFISDLPSGSYSIKLTGEISSSTISLIKSAMRTNANRYISLDLSDTTGLTSLDSEAFTTKVSYTYTGVPLTELILPSSVTSIGNDCFYNCKSLVTVNAPGVTTLGRTAFYVCEKLTDVTLADELVSIGDLAFGYCKSLKELTLNAAEIDSNVVCDDTSLEKLTIGAAVKTISTRGVIQGTTSLSEICVEPDNAYFKVVDGILYSSDETRLIRCPPALDISDLTLSETVTEIDEDAFSDCKYLTSVTLPNVTTVSTHAFMSCGSLTTVSIPKATKINGMAFYRCTSLSDISLPDTLTFIGMYAFAYDTNLTSIFIPASVTTIKSDAFEYWTASQTINCEPTYKPSGWDDKWSYYSYSTPAKAAVNWGASRE